MDNQPVTERLLAALAWCQPATGWQGLEAELQTTITRQTSKTPQPGARPTDTPVPFNVAASDAAGFLRWLLASWVDTLLTGDDVPPRNTITACAAWLTRHMDRIDTHDACADIESEICDAIHRALNSLDARTARHYAGPCPTCTHDMYTHLGGDTAECRTCDTKHDGRLEWREGKLEEAKQAPLTRKDLLTALPAVYEIEISAQRFDTWVRRGKIVATYRVWLFKEPDPRPPTYRVCDVQTLMAAQAAQDEKKVIR